MKAEIIAVGTEILLGDIVDTNSNYIVTRLPALGIDCYGIQSIGDNLQRLADAVRSALSRVDLVIMTGGLGPTGDDLTREAIAAAFDEPLAIDPGLEEWVRSLFAGRGWPMPERNVKQALLIPSARAIPNSRGTAPGWWVERDSKIVVAMPGVPPEMHHMWENEAEPELARRSTAAVIVSRTVKAAGIGEGSVDEMVSHLLKSPNPSIGVYAKADGIHLRITAKDATTDDCLRRIAPVKEEVRRILGTAVWGADDDTLPAAVGRLLAERGLTLATMESCTGGLLANNITDVDGSSVYFHGSLVTYATEEKIAHGVDARIIEEHGVISAQASIDMARAARAHMRADVGIGITGIAGPEPVEGKAPGTVHIGVDLRGRQDSVTNTFRQGRQQIKTRAVMTALFLLRRMLVEEGER